MQNTVYISGPMRGRKLFNFPEFDAAARRMEAQGFKVFNPAQMDRDQGFDPANLPEDTDWNDVGVIEGFDLRDALKRDCEAICQCTHIALLPGWQKSSGAMAEYRLARALGLMVLDQYGYPYTGIANNHAKQSDDKDELFTYVGPAGTMPIAPDPAVDPANPKDAIASRKPDLSLIPTSANILESIVLGLGSKKYGRFNWRDTKVRATVYVAALLRHLSQWADGEDIDSESGVSHLAHCRANCSILIDAMKSGCLIDDRSKGPAPRVLEELVKAN